MFKKFVAAFAALLATTVFAAVDVNNATQAELEAIPGVGPITSTLIINARKQSPFKDWTDFVSRVQGVGDRSAARFSEGGLTVNGKPYAGAPGTTKTAQASTGAKAASGAARAVDATKATAAKAASAVRTGAKAVASGARSTASNVGETAREQKDAAKESAAGAKAKLTESKAERAQSSTAASAPRK